MEYDEEVDAGEKQNLDEVQKMQAFSFSRAHADLLD